MHQSQGKEMTFQPVPDAPGRIGKEMAIMAEIGRIISSSLQIEEVYERFAEETRRLIPFDRISVNHLNPDRKTFTIAYVAGVDVPGRRPGEEYSIAGTISETVIGNRKGMLVLSDDSNDMSKKYPNSRALSAGMVSSICVPLISMAAIIGTLHFQTIKLKAYSEHDLNLAERIASYITGAIANARLFSSLTKTEAILRESEASYRAIFEQAAVGVAEMEFITGRFLTVNRRLCEIVGYSDREMLEMTFQSITHPEDRELHTEKMALALAGKTPNFIIEKRFLRKEGQPVWVNITISVLSKEGERPRNNLLIIQDITEQKRAEMALMQSEMKYRTLFESAGDYIFVLRPDRQKGLEIIDANKAAIEKHGYCREDLIGRSMLELNTPDSKVKKEEILRLLTKPGDTLLLETEHVNKNRQTFPVEVSARMIQIEPEPPFILAIERDITDRKRIERELSKSKEVSERLRQEMAIITEIGRKISSTLNIDEVYERLAAEVAKLIDYHRMMIVLLNPKKDRFLVAYFSGESYPERKVGDFFPVKESIGELVSSRRAGVIIQAADKQGILNACPRGGVDGVMRMGILSIMSVPLMSQDEVIGVIHFRSKKPNAYKDQDLRLAEGLGREIAGAIANARLYSDLRKTEKTLREGKELYSRLVDAVPDGVVQTDNEGYILLANEVALKTWGYSELEEIRGRNVFAFVAPEDRRRAEDNTNLGTGGKIVPQIYRLMVGDDRAINAEINANVLCTEEGTPYGKVLLFRDVTDRSKMEEALRASEAKYRFLTDNMNDVIWTVDLDLKTTFINRTIEKMLGYSPDAFMGKDLAEKCTPESYEHLRKVIAEQREIEKKGLGDPDGVITIEVEYYHREGSTVWMESLISGVRDKDGLLTGYHGVSRNIMERRKLEQELRKILDNLENRIRERTIELEEVNTALRVLLKKGEQDLRKLGHDVKDNIDRLVMPFLRKLRKNHSIEQNSTYVNIIETNLMHITSPFINQLSDSFKNLTPKEIQVAAMIRDGRSSKEIAEFLGVSVGTVVTHRNSIRKKLKLSSRDINLRSRLLSLA